MATRKPRAAAAPLPPPPAPTTEDALRANDGAGDAVMQVLLRLADQAAGAQMRAERQPLYRATLDDALRQEVRRARAGLRAALLPQWRTHDPELLRAGIETVTDEEKGEATP